MAPDLTESDRAGGEAPSRSKRRPPRRGGEVRELAQTVIFALILALLVRWFLLEVFVVSGASMLPTLQDSNRMLVNKLVYHLRDPERREIIVFAYPRDPSRDFIKRVIGLPGETVEVRGGRVYINGQLLDEPYIHDFGGPDQPPTVVPAGAVWVLGDNRPYSDDSRVFGPVDHRFLRGEAFVRYWPPQAMRSFP